MSALDYDWNEELERIRNNSDLLILYLSIANRLNAPIDFREFIDMLIKIYLEENHTTLKKIYHINFPTES